ncbi:MAG: hypothetical protein M1819_003459 [Sarea resinae]|nr:MAG: hypothetical protein M1819_003459 [Sarea resinae]
MNSTTFNASIDPDYCTLKNCTLEYANIHYIPSLGGNLAFLIIFAIILILQIGLGIFYRTWGFLGGMFGGLLLEVLGYVGRVQMHHNPFTQEPFLLYLICLTIGPAFLTASIYLCLARIVTVYGAYLSRIQPRSYTLIFISCDLLSLILQGAGGGIAATGNNKSQTDNGVNIMVAGLAFQVFSLALFIILWGEFTWRVRRSASETDQQFTHLTSSPKFKAFKCALALATVTILIRSIFRVAELAGGFDGKVANNEPAFMVLEGPMIIIAAVALTVFHPGFSFGGEWSAAAWSLRGRGDSKRPPSEEFDLVNNNA